MTRIPRLHLISNREICPLARFPGVARSAVAGGVDAIHLREPGLERGRLKELIQRVQKSIASSSAKLLINREIEVVWSAMTDGVHLAENQFAEICDARDRLPEGSLLGISIHSVEAALAASEAGVDYLIAGHVFETGSKPGQVGRGLEFIERISQAVTIPVIAIGGITPENTPDVRSAGAYGVAVMSGILSVTDPESAARRYSDAIYATRNGSKDEH